MYLLTSKGCPHLIAGLPIQPQDNRSNLPVAKHRLSLGLFMVFIVGGLWSGMTGTFWHWIPIFLAVSTMLLVARVLNKEEP
jgi:hypothetical protein